MKRSILFILWTFGLSALSIVRCPLSLGQAFAQDARHRVASTIIADGLAQLPARDLSVLEQVMGEMAGTGAEGVASIADMLQPSDQGKNAVFEYAIDGLTNYVNVQGRETQRAAVKQGLEMALERCTDEGNRLFLQGQLDKLLPRYAEVEHAEENLLQVAENARTIAKFRDKVNAMKPQKRPAFLVKTVKTSGNRQLRVTALEMGAALAADPAPSGSSSTASAPSASFTTASALSGLPAEFSSLISKAFSKLYIDAQTDVIRWAGNHHASDLFDLVEQAIVSPDSTLARAGFEAAGKMGGERAYQTLLTALDGDYADAAKAALTTFNGALTAEQVKTLKEKGIVFTTGTTQTGSDGAATGSATASSTSTFQRAVLSKEEAEAGFELLFDGLSLDKWKGNKTSYLPIDGTIQVTAQYGDNGNLYTKNTYSDFVFRFEFCFEKSGVNNGVGIRTREGVDAAYEGMEIQILDHDAPIYKGLRPYQQHGAVYGIIVPEHVTFGELGTWNTEEIRAEGDHITVTVNGKVILDGDIRKACQGHNMAPEAGKPNPYTVDHQSHPGLFNREGLISFCGHGEGLKLRNIRILDLSKKK